MNPGTGQYGTEKFRMVRLPTDVSNVRGARRPASPAGAGCAGGRRGRVGGSSLCGHRAELLVASMPRKKPFSTAQKKAQLQAKREKVRSGGRDEDGKGRRHFKDDWDFGVQATQAAGDATEPATVVFTKGQGRAATDVGAGPNLPSSRGGKAPMLGGGQSSLGMSNANGYKLRTVLTVDSKEVIEARRRDATRPLCYVHGPARLVSPVGLDPSKTIEMPKRPKWDPTWSAQKLEQREEQAFQTWLDSIYKSFETEQLNSFEHNLDVWRQLWRTVEKADILVMLADARAPLLHFSESLFRHIVQDHNKPAVLILNKADLVPTSVVTMWERYFHDAYPELKVVSLAACPAGVPISIGVAGAGVGLEGKAGGRHPRAHTFGETVATQGNDKEKEASAALLAAKKKELVRLKKCGVRVLRAEARELGLSEDLLTAAIGAFQRARIHVCMSASMNCLRIHSNRRRPRAHMFCRGCQSERRSDQAHFEEHQMA